MRKLFLAASGAFAAIPGLAIIWKGTGSPPGYEALFGGVIETFGALSLLILWSSKNRLKRVASRKVTSVSIKLGILAFVSICIYVVLFKFCVVENDLRGTAYYPLWTSGQIAEMVQRSGGRYAAIERYGIAAVVNAISKMPSFALGITTTVLLVVYQAIFTALTVGFAIIGFHKGKEI